MNFQKIDIFLSKLSHKSLLITTHDQVDLDGFASSLALKYFLETYLKSIEVHVFFPILSKYTISFKEKLMEKFPNFDFSSEEEHFIKLDYFIILDTNNLEQVVLPDIIKRTSKNIPFIFIDHHFDSEIKYEENLELYNIIFDNTTSTAEIIFDIYKHYQIDIPIVIRYLLIAAILADTGGFKYATNDTFHRISDLLQEDLSFQEVLMLTEKESDLSKKIAIIKGLQRVEIIRINNWLIGLSHVSSYTSSVASTMLNIGFDVSIVYSKELSNFRITTRAKKKICLETGLHLGQILAEISEGRGGGHDGAASLNGEVLFETTLNQILGKIKKTLINS